MPTTPAALGSSLSATELIDPLDAGGAPAFFADTIAFIRGGDAALAEARKLIDTADRRPLTSVRLAAPIDPHHHPLLGQQTTAPTTAEKANAPLSGQEPEFFVKTGDCVRRPGRPDHP